MKSSPILTQEVSEHTSQALILVVEDEFLIRMILCENLRNAGYQVIEAVSADHALAMLDKSIPDLVIADVRMPGSLDGIALLSALKLSAPNLPVIISSGHLMASEVMETSADSFVQKPYSFERMLKAVQIGLTAAQ